MERDQILQHIQESVLKKRDDVVSIVVFGSFAREKSYHDIDILVITSQQEGGRLERGPAMIALSRALDDLPAPAEIVLYSRSECQGNAKAHTPFFLDIACDGLVLYDTGFITPLLADLRRHIADRGIQRTPTGGWRFPVAFRHSTALSPLENRDWAKVWLEDAQRDMAAAEHLFAAGLHDKCVTHCQQTIEKSVKAVLACLGRLERTHYVARILEDEIYGLALGEWQSRLSALAEWARTLEPSATWSRYPGERGGQVWIPAREYDQERAAASLDLARRALTMGQEFVAWWFAQDDPESSVEGSN